MEVILRDHVDNLGKRGDVVKVADGFAQKLPAAAEAGLAGDRRQQAMDRARAQDRRGARGEERVAAEALADRLAALELQIGRKVGDNDTLYGSVTNADIAELLEDEGFRRRSQQDPVARCDSYAWRVARAGEIASRRDGAAEDHGRQGIDNRANDQEKNQRGRTQEKRPAFLFLLHNSFPPLFHSTWLQRLRPRPRRNSARFPTISRPSDRCWARS